MVRNGLSGSGFAFQQQDSIFITRFLRDFSRYKGFKTKGIPYPFVLVMEALSFLLRMTMESGFISCFRVGEEGRERVEISHPLFASNALLFGDPCLD